MEKILITPYHTPVKNYLTNEKLLTLLSHLMSNVNSECGHLPVLVHTNVICVEIMITHVPVYNCF